MELSSEMLVGIAGVVLSLLFSYIPGLRTWYAGLVTETKQLIMLGLLVVVTGAVFGLSCGGYIDSVACDKNGVISLIVMLVTGIVANQGAYLITPAVNDVVIAKQLRDDAEG